MKLGLVLVFFLSLWGRLIHLDGATDRQRLLLILLNLHKNHCGDVALCDNVTNHPEPSSYLIPVPCCVPCSCLSTCTKQRNCCPVIQTNMDVNSTPEELENNGEEIKTRPYVNIESTTTAKVTDSEPKWKSLTDQRVVTAKHCTNTEQSRLRGEDFEDRGHTHTKEIYNEFQSSSVVIKSNSRMEVTSSLNITVETVCVRPQVSHFLNKYLQSKEYIMVAACKNESTPMTDKCHSQMENRDFSNRIPVTSKISGLSYVNKECLLCNEIGTADANISVWQAAIVYYSNLFTYKFFSSFKSIITQLQLATTPKGFRNIHFLPRMAELATECYTFDITLCNQTGLWETHDEMIETICHCGHTLPVIHQINKERLLFKNIACVHCNTESDFNETELSCGYYDRNTPTRKLKPYSMILNSVAFEIVDGIKAVSPPYLDKNVFQELKTGRCSPGYVDIMGRCRTIFCPRDHFVSRDQCLPHYDYLNELELNMRIQIRPNQNIPKQFSALFVGNLKEIANDSLRNVKSLQTVELSLWHLPVSQRNPTEYYLFDIYFFNTTGTINYGLAVTEIQNIFNRIKSNKKLTLSTGLRIDLSFDFNHRIDILGRRMFDIEVQTGGRLLPLMGKEWTPRLPRPYMTISNVNWCYRTDFDAVEKVSKYSYRIMPADMIVYQHQVDIEYIKTSLGSVKLHAYACIDLFVEHVNVDREQTANRDSKTKIVDTYSMSQNNMVNIIVASAFGALLLGIILYKINSMSSGQRLQREDINDNNLCPTENPNN